MLSNEIDQFKSFCNSDYDVKTIILDCQKRTEAINKLIDSYRGKASEVCIEYFQKEWGYFIASDKLEYYRNNSWNKNYPSDFFLEVDTIPVLMNQFEWDSSYQKFIQMAQQYKQEKLGLAVSKRITDIFLPNYYFIQASLKGLPLYHQIARLIDQELRSGKSDNEIVNFYYQDFITNCANPALTKPLKKIYQTAEQLIIGKTFPIKSFTLKDSTIYNLEKFKGKPICLILLDWPIQTINGYKDEIAKFNQHEVEFIFAMIRSDYYIDKKADSTILEPNITYLELAEQDLKSKLLLNGTKIFMLDKWFRIVENNAEDPFSHKYHGRASNFEKSLRKTIETKKYSKAEKTAMLKIAGWSLGSILFTFMIGFWIYKIRIRQIKKQEALKRRIKDLEIKAIRSQMNPHFVFNALNSIQSLINGNQFKEANIYLSKFAVLLRGVLNNSEKSMVSLSDELKAVELYCQLEQLRFEFKFEINIDPEVNCDLIEIPGMIIQPLAENAIVHGLSPKGDQGKLSIQIERHNGDLCVGVSDNGVGLSPQANDTLSQKGFGLRLVEERLNILNLDGKMAKLTIQNKDNEPGTFAKLTIPIE